MAFGKKKAAPIDPVEVEVEAVYDPLSWMLNNEFANFVLFNTNEIVSL